MYLAIARKWRPALFDDLVGQGHVVQTLKNAILHDRVSHAYLFSGARGTGKTSVARIFAKALRCPQVVDALSCNQCSECVAISESRSVDVVEIDGASNNGVEAVRGLRDSIAYGTATGTYKIYIIDEVHMLSLSAFNALLKTLEEPPAHVVFIFATTEIQKIPLTVLGRCQRFDFKRLTQDQVMNRLKQVLAAEKRQISEDGLRTIASHCDGSLRDALSLLDQVLSFHALSNVSVLDENQVANSLGICEMSSSKNFLLFVVKKNIPSVIKLIKELYYAGVDLQHFAEQALAEFRLLYLTLLSQRHDSFLSADELELSASHHLDILELSKFATLIQIERCSQILSKTISQLHWATLPQYVLEMASVRMCLLGDLSQIENLAHPKSKPGEETTLPGIRKGDEINKVSKEINSSSDSEPWKDFVESAMKKRPLTGALLSHAGFQMEKQGGIQTILVAFPEGSFYEKQVSDPKNRQEIENHIFDFFGKETLISFSNQLDKANPSLTETKRREEALAKKEALGHPTIATIKQVTGAVVVDVRVD